MLLDLLHLCMDVFYYCSLFLLFYEHYFKYQIKMNTQTNE